MIRSLILFAALLLSPFAHSTDIEGYKFEDKITIGGKELLLNGVGLRTVVRYGLKFKVYVAGLYVEKRSTKAKEIIESGGIVYIKSYYMRSVTKAQQRKPFRDAIRKNCFADCSDSKKKILKVIDAVKTTKEGSNFDFTMYPDKVHFQMTGANESSDTIIEGKNFSKDMIAIWLGPEPPNESLKEGLLGKGMDWVKGVPAK